MPEPRHRRFPEDAATGSKVPADRRTLLVGNTQSLSPAKLGPLLRGHRRAAGHGAGHAQQKTHTPRQSDLHGSLLNWSKRRRTAMA